MKRGAAGKGGETWDEFEERVGLKRSGKKAKKVQGKLPSDLCVQRMSSTASGRLKKFEPLETRDFVPFDGYDELNLDNVKEACERYYKAPRGSCDLLASDRGPSCSNLEQIKGKKVYLIRFLQPEQGRGKADVLQSEPGSPAKKGPALGKPHASAIDVHRRQAQGTSTVFPHSVSIKDLLKAGKLIKPPQRRTIDLEYFDISISRWQSHGSVIIELEEEPFAGGAFRNAYRARCKDGSSPIRGNLVVKKYKELAEQTIKETLNQSVEDHTRKQVQMHSVARNLAQRFATKMPAEFGMSFTYGKAFYASIDGKSATVEQFVKGEFFKYINNDGKLCDAPGDEEEHDEVFKKAECFAHFTYEFSDKKLMVLDLQGSMFDLYDPEVATCEILEKTGDKAEYYFCAGNMSSIGIQNFCDVHKCNEYCAMMDLGNK